jgi:hypothetical protein
VIPRPKRAGGDPTTHDALGTSEADGTVPVAGLSIFDPVYMQYRSVKVTPV